MRKITVFCLLTFASLAAIQSCQKDSSSSTTQKSNAITNDQLAADSTTIDSSLLCYLPFKNNLKDQSGHGNNGVLHGTITYVADRFGNGSRAVSFAASNTWIEIPEAQFVGLKTGTIAMDFYATSTARQILISKMSYSIPFGSPGWYQSFLLVMQQDFSSPIQFNSKQPGYCDQQNGWNLGMTSNTGFTLNQWNHIAVAFNKTSEKMYLNGNLVANATRVVSPICQGEPIRLGVWWQGDPLFFTGNMDEVRIYNRALSGKEIKQLSVQ